MKRKNAYIAIIMGATNRERMKDRRIPEGKIREIEAILDRGHDVTIEEKYPRTVTGIKVASPRNRTHRKGSLVFLEL